MATSNERITDSEHNWLVKQGFDPDTSRWKFWWQNFINRRNYDGDLPPGITDERRRVDLLKMAEKLDRIEEKTTLIEGVTHMFASFWKHSAVRSEELYPTNKDTKRRK
jgi:hypothetical protein